METAAAATPASASPLAIVVLATDGIVRSWNPAAEMLFGWSAQEAVGRFLPSLEAFSSPYIWRDVDHMMKVVRGPIGEEMNQDMIAKTGIRVLDMGWFFGARHIAHGEQWRMAQTRLRGYDRLEREARDRQ